MLAYVLVTAARNEETCLPGLVAAVAKQTILPLKWVVVSDGSTDGTDDIVLRASSLYPWIELVRVAARGDRNFASKVYAFNEGYEKVKCLSYDVVVNLDADISFESDYLAYLLGKIEADPKLGVAGTCFVEGHATVYDYRFTNIEHVSGGCQMFRRECYEQIGGFRPIKEGGEDWVAVTTARMLGWSTRTFTAKHFVHHRPMGAAQGGFWRARVNDGHNDYLFGNHPMWQLFRVAYQCAKKPVVLGGLALFVGYASALLRGAHRPISAELEAFTRREQMQRLRLRIGRIFGLRRVSKEVGLDPISTSGKPA